MATSFSDAVKRLLVGRPFRTDRYRAQALPKRIAMPVFASDMLSSVTYAPDEILLALGVGGLSVMRLGPWVGLAVGVFILLLVLCYRFNLRAYPDGGGDYEVAAQNLGNRPATFVAASLLVDYALTLAVSMSVFAAYLGDAVPWLDDHRVWCAVVGIALVTLLGMRGWRTRHELLALPTYLFIAAVGVTIVTGTVRVALGETPTAPSSGLSVIGTGDDTLTTVGAVVLVLRAFSQGSVALSGVETVATAVPSFKKPRGVNAGNTLLLTGVIATVMLVTLTWLAARVGVKFVDDPARQLFDAAGHAVGAGYAQGPVLSQVAQAVFSFAPWLGYAVIGTAALVLLAAANSSVEGFPGLASRLARAGYLPRQLAQRGDRLTLSNGIVVLAVAAMVLVVATEARPTVLVQLYLVGVFCSFAIGQLGMVRHWSTRIRRIVSSPVRTRMILARAVAAFGFVIVTLVLLVVVVTKFTHGAWIALAAMFVLAAGMGLIQRHYRRVDSELAVEEDSTEVRRLPPNTHAVVVVTDIHKPTLHALSFARATRPTTLAAITVAVDEEAAAALQRRWDERRLPVPLTTVASPYRELVRPVLNYIARIRRNKPDDLVVVYIPQYIVGRWWEHLLHNQTVLRLKSRLLIVPNVVVATVPWRLRSFHRISDGIAARSGDFDAETWGDLK